MERLLTTSVERDGAEHVLLCSNTYDDLGRLATQRLGCTAEGSHAVSLTYDLNGNVTHIVRGIDNCFNTITVNDDIHMEYNGNHVSLNSIILCL